MEGSSCVSCVALKTHSLWRVEDWRPWFGQLQKQCVGLWNWHTFEYNAEIVDLRGGSIIEYWPLSEKQNEKGIEKDIR